MKLKNLLAAAATAPFLAGCMEGGSVDPSYVTAAGAAVGYSIGKNSNNGAAGAAIGALIGNTIARSVPDCRTQESLNTYAVRDNITGQVTHYTTQQSQNQTCTTYGRGNTAGSPRPIF